MVSFNNMTIMLAVIILQKYFNVHTPLRKAVTDTRVIQLTINHTLALENTLLNTLTWMVDLTCLKLDRTIE